METIKRELEGKTKWTPGPWECPEGPYLLTGKDEGPNFSGGDWEILPPLGESGPVAIVHGKSNARLIAAVTDLYDALDGLLAGWWNEYANFFGDSLENSEDFNRVSCIIAAHAALAKARGES